VAMTGEERQRFLDGIGRDYGAYYTMLGNVNAESSTCSRPADRESIHAGIRGSVGFAALSRMLFGVMEKWMEGEMRQQIAARLMAGDEEGAMRWTAILALVLWKQGSRANSLVLQERVLEFLRRVLPDDHPHTGEVDM
jgi:hypothetical protein